MKTKAIALVLLIGVALFFQGVGILAFVKRFHSLPEVCQ